ncbi:MAG: RusA family crossover junction endodeoxyribonuclease [Planctomycetes bacterium]|nr:RusA family crossover junction endodeoxyribonuclease [Planctomycetota bacterium]
MTDKKRRYKKERCIEAGRIANKQHLPDVDQFFENPTPTLLWRRRISVPFSYAASKNNMYVRRRNGQVMLRNESRQLRNDITMTIKSKLYGQKIAHNKVWVEILVQKPDHKGDAVNVIDLVCDALKDAIPVDDRWFSLHVLDWHVVKENPRLYISIGQETEEDAQVCSYCGLIKALDQFNKQKSSPIGVGRECISCRKEGRILAQQSSVT